MRKSLSRFFIFILLMLAAVLIGAVAAYLYRESSNADGSNDGAVGIPFLTPEKEESKEYSRIENKALTKPSEEEDDTISTYAYDALSGENLRYLYEKLDESVYRISDEMSEDGRYKTKLIEVTGVEYSSGDINVAINAYLYDHPQVFWIDNYFGYHSDENVTYVECYSVLSGNQCELYIEKFNEALGQMLADIDEGDGQYEREKILHDKLLEKCSYKKGVDSIEDGWQYFSAYGAIVDGEAVCEGYSKAMMLLLNLAGVDCATIRGKGEGNEQEWERHMWNVVKIGEDWYHLDSTWDDSEDNDVLYDFFNLTTEAVRADHIPDIELSEATYLDDFSYNFFIPECTSTEMNYFYRDGVVINSLDDKANDDIADKIYDLSTRGEYLVYIMIGDDVYYDDFMNLMLKNGGNQFYDCIERVNNYVGKEVYSTRHCHLTENPRRKTLRVRLADAE